MSVDIDSMKDVRPVEILLLTLFTCQGQEHVALLVQKDDEISNESSNI